MPDVKTHSAAKLYIVSTPIGNLSDFSPRAIETLQSVNLIAAEDTRHSGRLLQHFDIKTPMWAVHDHNERQQADRILQRLAEGENIALISDAGTPLISDPGFYLVRAVRQAGFDVVPIPGCCALIAALSVSGLPTDRFAFEGFAPVKQQAKLAFAEQLKAQTMTSVFYESPHRILNTMETLLTVLGEERYVVIAREMTKTFETVHGDSLGALVEWVKADSNQQKGEFVVLVEPLPAPESSAVEVESETILRKLMAQLSLKQAVSLTVDITGAKKKQIYQRALQIQDEE